MSKKLKFSLSSLLALATLIALPLNSSLAAVKKAPATDSSTILSAEGQSSAPEGSPTRAIQDIEKKMEAYKTDKNLSAEDVAKNKQLKREILSGAFDLTELSRLALDQHWAQLSSGERSHFVGLMTDLLETKAIFSKEQSKTQGKAYTVRYLGDTFVKRNAEAKSRTQVFVPKENVTVQIDYRLKKMGGEWRVFDIIVDDASLVENYRYQFDNIISKHGYADLIRRMSNKLSELKQQS